MSSSKFRDLSTGTKSLIIIEQILFVGALLLAVHLNGEYHIVDFFVVSDGFLIFYAVIFALLNQLSALALEIGRASCRERV